MQDYSNYLSKFDWNNNDEEVPIIPSVHGTSREIAHSISKTGFVALSLCDIGWYGKGVYLTTNCLYATPYFLSKTNPALLVCFAFLGNIYPVVEDHKGKGSLLGKPLLPGYNSHYVLTNKNGFVCTDFRVQYFTEIVVEQESQIIPAYILGINTTKASSLLETFVRTVPVNNDEETLTKIPMTE